MTRSAGGLTEYCACAFLIPDAFAVLSTEIASCLHCCTSTAGKRRTSAQVFENEAEIQTVETQLVSKLLKLRKIFLNLFMFCIMYAPAATAGVPEKVEMLDVQVPSYLYVTTQQNRSKS